MRTYVSQALAGRTEILRPWAGLNGTPVNSAMAAELGQAAPRGLRIDYLHPQSTFGLAGFRVGDVLLSVAGGEVNSMPELQFRMMTSRGDRPVPVKHLRRGEEKTRHGQYLRLLTIRRLFRLKLGVTRRFQD